MRRIFYGDIGGFVPVRGVLITSYLSKLLMSEGREGSVFLYLGSHNG